MNHDSKWDYQLAESLADEIKSAGYFDNIDFDLNTVELKSESYLWEKHGNICIEYARNGRLTGISITKASIWIHELKTERGETLMYLMLPVPRLKQLCRDAYYRGDYKLNAGDGGLSSIILLKLSELLRY